MFYNVYKCAVGRIKHNIWIHLLASQKSLVNYSNF